IAMIWLSVNLDCFIAELSSSMVENSTSDPVYLQGVLPTRAKAVAFRAYVLTHQLLQKGFDKYFCSKEFFLQVHSTGSRKVHHVNSNEPAE
ncbi:MAG: hypothetical protein LW710_04760, partial [Burkholderiales bacterium]|uniref:hypothetical protein n=1 Tax=Limnobacter sp. TaxID=2003368 RepID=UPI0039BC26A0|nr:hypothetical protein [Burkholderiales bacterium]